CGRSIVNAGGDRGLENPSKGGEESGMAEGGASGNGRGRPPVIETQFATALGGGGGAGIETHGSVAPLPACSLPGAHTRCNRPGASPDTGCSPAWLLSPRSPQCRPPGRGSCPRDRLRSPGCSLRRRTGSTPRWPERIPADEPADRGVVVALAEVLQSQP